MVTTNQFYDSRAAPVKFAVTVVIETVSFRYTSAFGVRPSTFGVRLAARRTASAKATASLAEARDLSSARRRKSRPPTGRSPLTADR
jgi:hypothetical protein